MRTPTLALVPAILRLSIAALTLAAAVVQVESQTSAPSSDERLKAAFVYRLPQFVEWPPESLDGKETLDICVAPPNPFGSTLQQLVEGESLNGQRLAVRHLTAGEDPSACRVLYLPGNRRVESIRRVADQPVLTIGDSETFLDQGGIIRLRLANRRVQFEVNAAAAERARLRLSSQLLRLAIAVRGLPE